MWSINLESQAEFARQKYAGLRDEAALWRAQRKPRQASAGRRLPGAAVAGRLLARLGGRLITTGVRWKQAAEANRLRAENRRATASAAELA